MEVRFDAKPKKGSKKSRTKTYAPTHGHRKVMFAPVSEAQQAESADEAQDESRADARAKNALKPFTRLMLVLCAFIFAGMILFVLTGYERISRAYQQVNAINSAIDTAKLNINALDVAIECAVTIDDAKAWAKAHNMQYPLQSQYIASGEAIPAAAAAPVAVSGTDPTATAAPDAAASPVQGDPATQPPDGGGDPAATPAAQ